jgi:hypothetical protein
MFLQGIEGMLGYSEKITGRLHWFHFRVLEDRDSKLKTLVVFAPTKY